MKNKLTTLLFLAFTSLMYAQHNSSIDLVGAIEYSYRTYSYSGNDDLFIRLVEERNEEEKGKSNWRFGFNYNKRLTNKLFLKTGLRLASIGYKGEEQTGLRWGSDHDGMGGFSPSPDPTIPREVQIIDNYIFLEVPIMARWEWGAKKWTTFMETGLSPHIYLTNRNRIITDISNEIEWSAVKPDGFNKIQFVASLSFGTNYQLNDTLQFFAQPVARYHITQQGKGDVNERLWSVGLEVGIRKML